MCAISVVIPTYNRSQLLARAIESTLSQTVPPAQVIVVDDGSTDDTAEICRRYGERIEYLYQGNAGASVARNLGVTKSIHPWIAFLDSDDYWTSTHLENMVAAIKGTEGTARFYFCDMQLSPEDGGGTLWEMLGFRPPSPFYLTHDATAWMLMRRQPTMLQCCVFHKQVLKDAKGLQSRFKLMHDSELFCRLGIEASVCAVSGVGCVQTSDAHSGNRLTHTIVENTEPYLIEQSSLWSTVLDLFPEMEPSYRKLVRGGLANSYWRRCRFYWRSGRRLLGVTYFLRSAACDPAFIAWLMAKRTSEGYPARQDLTQCSDSSLSPGLNHASR